MSKNIVLAVELLERKSTGVEVSVVRLSDEAKRALSTSGATIVVPPQAGLQAGGSKNPSKSNR